MAGPAKPCSPQPFAERAAGHQDIGTAVEWLLPVLREVLQKELRDIRDLKPLHDSLAARLDAASQENAAQFETLREIVKRLSTSLKDKAEVAEVGVLVEQQCCDRMEALERFCNDLGAQMGSFQEEHRKANIISAQAMPKEADRSGGLALDSTVKQFCIDSGRGDPPCDRAWDETSEPHLMRYESELERLRCMIFEGQAATEQLRAAFVQEHETGVAERARLDGLQKSLADNVVTLSRTHSSVGERLQQMQQMVDNLTNTMMENLHNSSTEAVVGEAAKQGLGALRHRLENMETSLKADHALICERQDSMENMISEENRRIWLTMENHLGNVAMSVTPAPLHPRRPQQPVNTSGSVATTSVPLLMTVAPVAVPSASAPQPALLGNLSNSARLMNIGTPMESPRRLYASSRAATPPGNRSTAQLSSQAASSQAASRQRGFCSSPPLPVFTVSTEPTTMRSSSGSVTPPRCTSPAPGTPTRLSATPPLSGSPPLPSHPTTAPTPAKGGSPMRPMTPVLASRSQGPAASSPSPSRKQTPRLPGSSAMAAPGAPTLRSPVSSPVMPHRNSASRNRGATPNNPAAVHRRRQENASRASWPFERT